MSPGLGEVHHFCQKCHVLNHYNSEGGLVEEGPAEWGLAEGGPAEEGLAEEGLAEGDPTEGGQRDICLSEIAMCCVEHCAESLRHIDDCPFCHTLCLWRGMEYWWRNAYLPKWL